MSLRPIFLFDYLLEGRKKVKDGMVCIYGDKPYDIETPLKNNKKKKERRRDEKKNPFHSPSIR